MEELKFLEEQQVAPELIKRVEEFRSRYEVVPETADRIVKPSIPFYGKDILEMAIAGLLKGENLLLTGPKATGKNILAENLAYIFNRPAYNVSFHVNTNSGDLIGTDTFVDNEAPQRNYLSVCRIRWFRNPRRDQYGKERCSFRSSCNFGLSPFHRCPGL